MADRTAKIDFELDWPVQHNGKEIRTIKVRRPRGEDLYHLPENDKGGAVALFPYTSSLISSPTGEPLGEEFLRNMDLADYRALGELIASFSERAGPLRRSPAA